MKKRVTKTFFLLVTFLMPPSLVLAAPSVSSVNGTIADGQSVTISGNGFGAKSPAAPVKWANFESATVGASIFSSGIDRIAGGDGVSTPYIRNDQSYGLGTKSARMDYPTPSIVLGHASSGLFPTAGVIIPNSLQVYVSYRMRYAFGTFVQGGGILKLSRGGSGGVYSGLPTYYKTLQAIGSGSVTWGGIAYRTDDGTYFSISNWTEGNTANNWDREEVYYKLSNPAGSSTGTMYEWVNGILNTPLFNNVVTRQNGSSAYIDHVISAFDGFDSYTITNDTQPFQVWMDDFYVDITQARVEICSGSNWANKGTCEIQIPSAWASDGTSATVTINQGSFANSSVKYLYVVDSTGTANVSGTQITFGGGATGTPAPAAPGIVMSGMSISPIGTSGGLRFSVNLPEPGNFRVRLVDVSGRSVYCKNYRADHGGASEIELSLGPMQKANNGVYFVVLEKDCVKSICKAPFIR